MAKGKWAQGIKPSRFDWIIGDQLAICVRPGGTGTSHRRVRRQEEVLWLRERRFSAIVSLLPTSHNLHSYDELGMPWRHWPFPADVDYERSLPLYYDELSKLLAERKKLVMHLDEVDDRLGGFIGGYLRWKAMIPETFVAIMMTERLLKRQLGPVGREIVTVAGELIDEHKRECEARKKRSQPMNAAAAPDAEFVPLTQSNWIG